ncbi:hypothetical protein COBT_002730, partial [Conglomerata obtusa]
MFLCSLYVIYANCTFNDAENFYDITIEPANDIVRKLTQSCENKEREFYIVTKLYNKEEICSIASFLTFLFYDEMKFYKKKYFCYTHCYNEFQFQKEFFLTYIKNYFDVTDDFCQSELFESKWNFGQGTVTSTHVALDVNDEFETKFYNYVTNIDEEQPKEKSGHEKERKIIFISNHKINTVQKLAFYNILKSNEKLGCNLLLIFSIMIEKNIEKEVIYYNLIDNYTRTEYFCQSFGFDFKNFCFFSFYESCKYTDKVFFLKSINCQQEFEKIQLLKISKNTIDNAKHVIYEMYDVKFKMEFFVSKTKIVYVINISYMKWYMEAKFWYIENETTNYNAHFMTLVIGRHDSLVLSSHDNSENNFKFNFKSNLDNVYKYCISHHKFLVTNLQNIIEFPLVCQYLDRSFDNYLDCDYINKYAKSKYIQLQFTDCEKEVAIMNVIDYLISNIAQNTNKNEKIYIFKTLLSIKMVENNKPRFFYEYCTEETIKNKKIIRCNYYKTRTNQINAQSYVPYAVSYNTIYEAFCPYEQTDNNVLVFMIFLHSGCYVQKYIIAIDFHSYRCKLGDCI